MDDFLTQLLQLEKDSPNDLVGVKRHSEQKTLKHRKATLKKYGLSLEEYDVMFDAQNGVCALCLEGTYESLQVDHNHITGEVRKLLCANCNKGLGMFKEDTEVLKRAIEYLGG